MIAYFGRQTAWPITDAGVLLVTPGNPAELHDALVRVLAEPEVRASLRSRNNQVYREHLSWPAIAARFAALLKSP